MASLVRTGSALLLLVLTVLTTTPSSRAYDLNRCYCVSQFDDTLRAKIAEFDPTPTPPQYQYVGIKPLLNETYEPCFCSDVTRVQTVLTVTSTEWVTMAETVSNQAILVNNVSAVLESNLGTLRIQVTEQETLDRFNKVSYKNSTDIEVLFDVEVLFRGHDQELAQKLLPLLKTELNREDVDFSTGAMTANVVSCGGSPTAPTNGEKEVTPGNLASGTAAYSCKLGYRLSTLKDEEVITCSHSQTWGTLPSPLTCDKQPDCTGSAPAPPKNAITSYEKGIYPSGVPVSYTCMEAYSDSQYTMAHSKCLGGTWSDVDPVLDCRHTGCLMAPPNVPDHGVIDWNHQRGNGAKAKYRCEEGYKSDNGYYPEVVCTNKTWVGFPSDWRCIRYDAPIKEPVVIVDEVELNYFFVVTIPSVAGLVLVILICLCCTRTDSPLFNICSTRVNKPPSYSKA